MQQLSEREIRFLCWKIKQGRKLPRHKTAALLDALLRETQNRKSAVNDNAPMPAAMGCDRKGELFRRYEKSVALWMKCAMDLSAAAGRRATNYEELWKQVVDTRTRMTRAKREYQRHLDEHGCGDHRS